MKKYLLIASFIVVFFLGFWGHSMIKPTETKVITYRISEEEKKCEELGGSFWLSQSWENWHQPECHVSKDLFEGDYESNFPVYKFNEN